MSLLIGHSGDSILWSKTEGHLLGFFLLIHSVRDGDFEVKFALDFRIGFKEGNNLALLWRSKVRLKIKLMKNIVYGKSMQCHSKEGLGHIPKAKMNDNLLWTRNK